MKRNIFGIFDTFKEVNDALLLLESNGYGRDDISVIGQEGILRSDDTSETVEDAGKGAGIGGLLGLIAGVAALPIPGIGPILGTGSIVTGLLGGAGVGAAAGGLVGAFRDLFGDQGDLAEKYESAIREGKILLAVSTVDTKSDEVKQLMENAGAHDLFEQGIVE